MNLINVKLYTVDHNSVAASTAPSIREFIHLRGQPISFQDESNVNCIL